MRNMTPEKAWQEGTNIMTALRIDGAVVRAWLATRLAETVKAVGAKRSLYETTQLTDACDAIIEEFPTLKLEEIAYVFRQLERGKLLPDLYGSFLTRDLMEAFRKYESEVRAPILEKSHEVKDPRHWTERTSEKLDAEFFRPILLTEQDMLDIEKYGKAASDKE